MGAAAAQAMMHVVMGRIHREEVPIWKGFKEDAPESPAMWSILWTKICAGLVNGGKSWAMGCVPRRSFRKTDHR